MKLQLIHFLAIIGLVSLLIFSCSIQSVQGDDDETEDEGIVFADEEGDEEDEEFEDYEDYEEPESMTIDGQTIHFGIPGEDDEFHSQHIPEEYKCDACYIVVNQFRETLDKANQKRPSLKKNLPESEIIDLLEGVCSAEWMDVGIKQIGGKSRLAGPGLGREDEPGIMQGGGKWPYRMHALCMDILGEVGEDQIYEYYLKKDMDTRICMVDYNVCVKRLSKPKVAKPKKVEL